MERKGGCVGAGLVVRGRDNREVEVKMPRPIAEGEDEAEAEAEDVRSQRLLTGPEVLEFDDGREAGRDGVFSDVGEVADESITIPMSLRPRRPASKGL